MERLIIHAVKDYSTKGDYVAYFKNEDAAHKDAYERALKTLKEVRTHHPFAEMVKHGTAYKIDYKDGSYINGTAVHSILVQ